MRSASVPILFCLILFCSNHRPTASADTANQPTNAAKPTPLILEKSKATPIAIDCTFNNVDPVKLHLHGFSNTKVAPEKIAVWRYSRPEFNPRIQYSPNYIIVGTGFGHVTKETNRAELGAKLRKVASDHGANVIAYEISGTEFRVQFLRARDEVFKAGSPQRDLKPSQ